MNCEESNFLEENSEIRILIEDEGDHFLGILGFDRIGQKVSNWYGMIWYKQFV